MSVLNEAIAQLPSEPGIPVPEGSYALLCAIAFGAMTWMAMRRRSR